MNESDKQKADLEWLYSDRPREPRQEDPTRVISSQPLDPARTERPSDGERPGNTQRPPAQPGHTRVMPAVDGHHSAGGSRPPAQAAPRTSSTRASGAGGATVPPRGPAQGRNLQAPPPERRVRRRRRGGVGRTLLVLLLLVLVWLVGVPLYHVNRAGSIDATPTGERPAQQPGTAILLAGNDARAGVAGARTDSMMILFLPTTGKPALISLPRDSYLPIPGRGNNKLNAAYAFGGPKLLVQTVESNTGLRIDGYLEISMAAFPEAVDAVGGIELCLDKPMKDKDSKADFPAGCQQMDGADALAYSRMRKADPRGDLGRIDRQREVIAAVTKKALSPQTLLPWRYWNLSAAGSKLMTKSSETSVGELGQAALGFRTVSSGNGISMTVPISNPAAQTSAGSSVLWDKDLSAKLFADLARGDTSKITTYQR